MRWYAIRTVYLVGSKSDGANVFEERAVCFSASSWEEAHRKAGVESQEYAGANGFEAHAEQVGYEQDGEPLLDGYEVWSEFFESKLDLDDFYRARYLAFLYTPEPSEP
ncbi:MAG: hypothetical protein U0359_16710 [Byssovorax sp.]